MSKGMKISFGVVIALIVALAATLFVLTAQSQSSAGEFKLRVEAARRLAEGWISEESKTYPFDGHNLEFNEASSLSCENCYQFSFVFQSSHAGLGDRSGGILAQVITPHKIVVFVNDGAIASAITDGIYDELAGRYLVRE